MTVPHTLADIQTKVRRIIGRNNANTITDDQINSYINTFYIYDMSEHLHLIDLRFNYQFVTNANQPVYDFPREFYLTNMPPVFIAGYQSYMTQSRENFFRINPNLNFLQQGAAVGNGTDGPYSFYCTQVPVMRGFKPNPPGAYSSSGPILPSPTDIAPAFINWNVLVSGTDINGNSVCLVDDGGGTSGNNIGYLFDPTGATSVASAAQGTINYITGQVNITNFSTSIAQGANINCQYIPYVASRPQSVVYYQTQFILSPVPDQAYTVSFEAYKYPTALIANTDVPQLAEWWQLLAFGAADKIFCDNGDLENLTKFRPLLEEQMKLVQRRTIVQQTSERSATIYTEQSQFPQFPFGNLFSGF